MGDILIKNADYILTMDDARRELHGADIHLHEGEIIAVAQNYAPPVDCEVVQAEGCVVTPGLVNTHHHLTVNGRRVILRDGYNFSLM